MKEFLRVYRWGMEMKFRMALYTMALIFFKGLANLQRGISQVSVWTMLQMLLAAMLLAILESALFRSGALDRDTLRRRTVVWAACANVLLVGGAAVFDWFAGTPTWGKGLLLAFFEVSLVFIWVGEHLALRRDTQALNDNLRQFQGEQP